jgi:HD-GYP domain-containing protein (c-di-GMP phosphodiesterase class II)
MKIKREALRAGCTVTEDVYAKTNQPIIRKQTVLTDCHLKVLEAFLIDEVETETSEREVLQEKEKRISKEKPSFIERYLKAVADYKKTFEGWQSGEIVDVYTLHRLFVTLFDEAVMQPKELFCLHRYADKADYLFHHAVATALVSAFLGKKCGYPKADWQQIGLAGGLCDCGMAKVSLTFLKSERTPSAREREAIRQHPVYSYQMLKSHPALKEGARLAVSQHHEREDGSGYPLGMKGKQLHPFSKIVAVADSFHAMTCERSYRMGRSPFQVIEMLKEEQFGRFDLNVLQVLSKEMVCFSAGTKVRLTDQRHAEIVFIPPHTPTKPIVRLENGEMMTLTDHPELSVDAILT